MRNVAGGLLAVALCALNASAAHAQSMSVTSAEIKDGGTVANEQVANVFGCKGNNISPSLNWTGAPSGTKSFAITLYDPDAPTGSGWWHWVVFNIPPKTTSLPKNAGNLKANLMPRAAIQGRSDFGFNGYGGPCPPAGDPPHHYTLTVFAVDVDRLPDAKNAGTPVPIVGFDLHGHTLAKASLTATYGR